MTGRGNSNGEWNGICDVSRLPDGVKEPPETCHCGDLRGSSYSDIDCRIVEQLAFEKALSIFLFLYDLIVIAICAYWLITFWRHRHMRAYKYSLKVRRPFYMILSYVMILPFIFEDGIQTIYLFWEKVEPSRSLKWDGVNWWTQWDGSPIYFGRNADIALHFFYWFGFWSFFQLKIFKLWMLRYDYEYSKEMSNIEWKDHLGLRTVEPASFFIRYRSILGNSFLMFFLQLVILVIVIFIQIFIRLVPILAQSPSAPTIEGIIILIIAISEFIFIVWLMHQIRAVNDNFYLKAESNKIFIASLIGGGSWIIGLIIASTATSISFIWVKTGTILLFTTWICVYCYFETIWVLKRIDDDWVKMRQTTYNKAAEQHHHHKNNNNNNNDKNNNNNNNNQHHIHSQSNFCLYLKLGDILQVQEGFEAMMRFLVKEFSCENLLCYVELSQYITTWRPPPTSGATPQFIGNGLEESALNNNYLDDDGSVTAEQHNMNEHIQQVQMMQYYENAHNNPNDLNEDDLNSQLSIDMFPYFENPEFEDELGHYEYIMQKYIYDSACLQINIAGGLRAEAQNTSPGMGGTEMIKILNQIRAELWSLMRDSFTRFRNTVEYKRLAEILQSKPNFKQKILNLRNGHHSPRNHANHHPSSADFAHH